VFGKNTPGYDLIRDRMQNFGTECCSATVGGARDAGRCRILRCTTYALGVR
jgi:hypothetical protein